MVSVGNGPDVGGGAEITPDADPEDGRLDVMVSFSVGPLARFGYAAKLRLGRHHERRRRAYTCAPGPSRSPARRFYCSADGELYGPERHRTWTVEPGAFR